MASVDQQTMDRPVDMGDARPQQQDALAQKATKFEFRRSVFVQEAPSSKKEANEFISFSQTSRADMTRFLGRYVTNIHAEATSPDGKETLKAQPHAQELLRVLGGEGDRLDQQELDKKAKEMLNSPDGWMLGEVLRDQETALMMFAMGLEYSAKETEKQKDARTTARNQTPEQAASQKPPEPEQTDERGRARKVWDRLRGQSKLITAAEGAAVGGLVGVGLVEATTNADFHNFVADVSTNIGEWFAGQSPTTLTALGTGVVGAAIGTYLGGRNEQGNQTPDQVHQAFKARADALRSIQNDKAYARYVKATIGVDVEDFIINESDKTISIRERPQSTASFTDLLEGVAANLESRDRDLKELGIPETMRDFSPERFILEGKAGEYERTGLRVHKRIMDKYHDLEGPPQRKESFDETERQALLKDRNGRSPEDPLWGRGYGSDAEISDFDENNIPDRWGQDSNSLWYLRAPAEDIYYRGPNTPPEGVPVNKLNKLSYNPVTRDYEYTEITEGGTENYPLEYIHYRDDKSTFHTAYYNANTKEYYYKKLGKTIIVDESRIFYKTPDDFDQTQAPNVRMSQVAIPITSLVFSEGSGLFREKVETIRNFSEGDLFYQDPDTSTVVSLIDRRPHGEDLMPFDPEAPEAFLYGRQVISGIAPVAELTPDERRLQLKTIKPESFTTLDRQGRDPSDPYYGIDINSEAFRDSRLPTPDQFNTRYPLEMEANFFAHSNPHFDRGLDRWGQGPSSPFFARTNGAEYQQFITPDMFAALPADTEEQIKHLREARVFVMVDLTERVVERMKAHPEPSISLIEEEIKARKEGGKFIQERKDQIERDKPILESCISNLREKQIAIETYQQTTSEISIAKNDLSTFLEQTFGEELSTTAARQKIQQAKRGDIEMTFVINGESLSIEPIEKRRKEAREEFSDKGVELVREHPRETDEPLENYKTRVRELQRGLQEEFNATMQEIREDENRLKQIEDAIRQREQGISQHEAEINPNVTLAKTVQETLSPHPIDLQNLTQEIIVDSTTSRTEKISEDDFRSLTINQLFRKINVLHEKNSNFGWPTEENSETSHQNTVLNAILEAKTSGTSDPDNRIQTMNELLLQMERRVKQMERNVEKIDLTGEISELTTIQELMKRQGAILGTRTKFMADIDTYIPLQAGAVQILSELPYSEQQRYTREEQTYGNASEVDRETYGRTILLPAQDEYRRIMTDPRSTDKEIAEARLKYEKAQDDAPEVPPAAAYFELMNVLFDYQSKSGDERAETFKTISKILSPTRLAQIFRDNPEISIQGNNLNEMLLNLNKQIKNGKLTRVDLRRLFIGIIDNVQDKALAGNLALAA